MGESICKRCGKPIIWLTLADRKKDPVDIEKLEFVIRGPEGDLFLHEGYVAHWETCDNPVNEFSEEENP